MGTQDRKEEGKARMNDIVVLSSQINQNYLLKIMRYFSFP